jgi:hypothetical protein
MARIKGRAPVTFSISPDLLAVVDAHAQAVVLDRYDVIRTAIAKGMVVMRVERELLMDSDGHYMAAIIKAAAGDADVENMQRIERGIVTGLERDVPGGPNALKPRRKVKAHVT